MCPSMECANSLARLHGANTRCWEMEALMWTLASECPHYIPVSLTLTCLSHSEASLEPLWTRQPMWITRMMFWFSLHWLPFHLVFSPACLPDSSFLWVIAHLCVTSTWGQEIRKDGRGTFVCVQLENLKCFPMPGTVEGQEDRAIPWHQGDPCIIVQEVLALPPNYKAESSGKTCGAERVVKEIQQNPRDANCPSLSLLPSRPSWWQASLPFAYL